MYSNLARQLKTIFRGLVARALERRVQKVIRQKHLKVVAVTGSVGKTSTKLAIATVLKRKYKVLVHEGNYNSQIGLPLSVFEMEVPETLVNPISWVKILRQIDKKIASYPYQVLVLELGADQPGDIQKFMRFLHPDVGVVTAIKPVHIENFASIDEIANEKMSLARGSRAVLLNAEDERVMQEAKGLGSPVQTYGVQEGGVHFRDAKRGADLLLKGKLTLNNDVIEVQSRFLGSHSLSALAAAGAVGEELGVEGQEIKAALEAIEPFAGRMRVLKGKDGAVLIDDTYNAAPASVKAAIETLTEIPGRHIAILGSMNELGDYSEEGHREVGKAAAKADMLITIGKTAQKFMVAGAASEGMEPDRIHSFDSPYKAGEFAAQQLRKGDVVLVKGSQNGVFSEEALAQLLASEADKKLLVRQSPAWIKRKQEQFT